MFVFEQPPSEPGDAEERIRTAVERGPSQPFQWGKLKSELERRGCGFKSEEHHAYGVFMATLSFECPHGTVEARYTPLGLGYPNMIEFECVGYDTRPRAMTAERAMEEYFWGGWD